MAALHRRLGRCETHLAAQSALLKKVATIVDRTDARQGGVELPQAQPIEVPRAHARMRGLPARRAPGLVRRHVRLQLYYFSPFLTI